MYVSLPAVAGGKSSCAFALSVHTPSRLEELGRRRLMLSALILRTGRVYTDTVFARCHNY